MGALAPRGGGGSTGTELRCLVPCNRCTVPTVNQSTGLRPDGANPTKELRDFRTMTSDVAGAWSELGPMFGLWCAPDLPSRSGCPPQIIREGDRVEVVSRVNAGDTNYMHWTGKAECVVQQACELAADPRPKKSQ